MRGKLARVAGSAVKVDARVRSTRQRLRDALVALVREGDYRTVTIRDIAKRANVGYATYFRHYADKEGLLLDLLEELLADLMGLLEPTLADEDASRSGALVFAHVRANADLYRVLISSQRSVDVLARASSVGMEALLRRHVPSEDALLPPEAAVNHLIASFVALVEWWLAAGMQPDVDRMGAALERLIVAPVRAVAFRRVGTPEAS